LIADYSRVLSHHFSDEAAVRAARAAIDEYFGSDGYSGSQFELIADVSEPDTITPRDIVAVSTLGVSVPPHVAVWLLSEKGRSTVSSLLAQVPADLDVWDALTHIAKGKPLWRLWEKLDQEAWPRPTPGNGMGPTTISKLLATKRPRLVPIQDSVVMKLFPRTDNWWMSFANALMSSELRHAVRDGTSNAPDHLSLLRRIDVVLWMQYKPKTER
jgi:hypothetical protein